MRIIVDLPTGMDHRVAFRRIAAAMRDQLDSVDAKFPDGSAVAIRKCGDGWLCTVLLERDEFGIGVL